MYHISRIKDEPAVQAIIRSFHDDIEYILELAIAIQQIPAPTFAEVERAAFIEERLSSIGLVNVEQDELHNVYGRLPATEPQYPPIIISAHSDTVFPAGTDLSVRRDDQFIHGPGISDNSTGVAGIIILAKKLMESGLKLAADIWFVSNVGEEGLGNLRGMRAVVKRFGPEATYIVVEGGLYGQISHRAIGVERYKIIVETPGGHSWGSFGNPSAIHELGKIIVSIGNIEVPEEPKTTFNVGVIEGGTSINTIAQTACLLLDCRSQEPEPLAELVTAVANIVNRANALKDVKVAMEMIGSRPAGAISREAKLVIEAEAALQAVGCQKPRFIASSTDANIPLSQGLNAVCIGLAESSNAHRLDEYMDPENLANGLGQLLLLTLATANY